MHNEIGELLQTSIKEQRI